MVTDHLFGGSVSEKCDLEKERKRVKLFHSWAELKDHCRKYGEVTYTDAHFRSGEGRGEVCFSERSEMEKALDDLDGQEIMGKSVRVSKSRDNTGEDYNRRGSRGGGGRFDRRRSRSRSRSRGRGGGRGGGGRDRPHRTAFTLAVDNLSSRCDWSQLKDIMRRVGEVTYVDAHNRMGRGRGECCFGTRDIMLKAKDELDGFEINGKRIELSIKEDGSRSPSPGRNGGGGRDASRERGDDRRYRGGRGQSRSYSRSRSGSRDRYR